MRTITLPSGQQAQVICDSGGFLEIRIFGSRTKSWISKQFLNASRPKKSNAQTKA